MKSSPFSENGDRVSPPWHASEDSSSRLEPASSTRPVRAEPTTAVHTASTTGSDPQVSARPVISIPLSFDALSKEPIPLKGCVLWSRDAFTVRLMASAKDKWRMLFVP